MNLDDKSKGYTMKIFKMQPYRMHHYPCNLSTILYHLSSGHLDLNAYYQRDLEVFV